MRIVLIRHFSTPGNALGNYIGKTDEEIVPIQCNTKLNEYPKCNSLYVSPMRRCIQTADIIYPHMKYVMVEKLRECDFGQFENKNYEMLKENQCYQNWLDSNGTIAFPDGEDPLNFRKRCVEGFHESIMCSIRNHEESVGFVVHGGTIMSILEAYDENEQTFYDYQIGNGCGCVAELKEESWINGHCQLIHVCKFE